MSAFKLIVCGCTGGPKEKNLSCYLLSPIEKNEFIALDAGTLLTGIEAAIKKGNLHGDLAKFFHQDLRAFLISHAHLDHVLGLIINSQSDQAKPILASVGTIEALHKHLFNGSIWPNFSNEGEENIGLYTYERLSFFEKRRIPKSTMFVEMFPLSHDRHCESSAFLIESEGQFALYFGDTAPDHYSGKNNMKAVWEKMAPLVRENKLKGIVLECSYPQGEKGGGVRYHLDTLSFMKEIDVLAQLSNTSLEGLPIIVAHRKEALEPSQKPLQKIAQELQQTNRHKIKLIFPEQGDLILL